MEKYENARMILARDYKPPKVNKPKKSLDVTSIEDIIENKPSIRKVRKYFKAVMKEINEEEISD